MAQLVAGIAGAAGAAAGGAVGVERQREADDMAKVQPTQESTPTPQPEPEHRPLSARGITLVTAVKGAPVTYIRNVDRVTDLDQYIEKPHVPRANLAISREHPDGEPHQGLGEHLTVMQQHVAWFDFNKDGILQPWETCKGFRLLGWNPIVSLMATFVIHASFSFPTHDSWLISPTLPIYIRNIHSCKHGSDSETYDTEGRFVVEKFEEMFSKYDRQNQGGFYFRDILRMVRGNFNVYDPFGWFAESSEWTFAWWLAKDRNGFLSKEAIRGIFDGTFFQHAVETRYKKDK
eukprot:SM000023S07558  [mRNA]  locus=s23:181851:183858:+ [translate_table: standard]